MSRRNDWQHRRGGGCYSEAAYPQPILIENTAVKPTKSWLPKIVVGDDQGADGACVIFGMCNWVETMTGERITSARALSIYRDTLRSVGRADGGLYPYEGLAGMKAAGLLRPGGKLIRTSSLSALSSQPILAIYRCGESWNRWNAAGCLDHLAKPPPMELHLVCIVGSGRLEQPHGEPDQYVWLQNSWGKSWAWRGIGLMNYSLHLRDCWEMWTIRGGVA